MENELVTRVEPKAVALYDRILEAALTNGAPLDQLEKFLQLKREHEAHEARKEFYASLAAFHQEKITIKKDKYNNHFGSWYSSLGNLLETVNPFLGQHSLSARFVPDQSEDKILKVTCVLQHSMGHTESVSLQAPPDTSGSKNLVQQIKSTFTYLRSATFEAVTGLSGTEASADDDGNSNSTVAYVSGKDLKTLVDLHDKVVTDKEKFLSIAGANSLQTIPKANYNKMMGLLNEARVRLATTKKDDTSDREPGEDG